VRVTVADTGFGIQPDSMKQLFEPFYSTKKHFGTGLGLWITKGIVKKHSGKIRVRSKVGDRNAGTAVSVFLPATPTIVESNESLSVPTWAQ
jgi:signal transduction histidine kinase